MSRKMTLLAMVQDILNDMSSDEVNSIDDTPEAEQVAQIVKTTYFEIIENNNWPHLKTLAQLSPVGSSQPTHMSLDADFQRVLDLRYDKRAEAGDKKLYSKVVYKSPEDFLDILNSRDSTDSTVTTVSDTIDLLIRNDRQPEYWTSFNDETIVFDSYNSDLESNLQQSKTQATVYKSPSWTHTDSAIPDLPAKAFSFFLSEAKSACFLKLKQTEDPIEVARARRQRVGLSTDRWVIAGGIKRPNYGRK